MTRKFFVMFVALIGFGICAYAQENSDNSVNLFDLKISSQGGIVEKINLETDIFDNVYRNCYKLGYHPWRGDTYIEFVLNKKYKSFSVTLVVPHVEKESEIFVEIMGDSKILYKSEGLTQKTRAKEIVLDVSEQDFIRIKVVATDYGLSVLLANGKVIGSETKESSVVKEKPVEKPVEKPGTSVLINGVRWATRNVDKPGTFAAKPEDAGMFYQWGSNVGWSSMNPLTATDGNNTWRKLADYGDTWQSAKNPCPSGWRVPTSEEWGSIFNGSATSGAPSTATANTWTWNSTGTPGYILSPDGGLHYTLFLPAAGSRFYYNANFSYVGTNGLYHSSTASGSIAKTMNFTNTLIDPQSGNMVSRAHGFSVRCVSE